MIPDVFRGVVRVGVFALVLSLLAACGGPQGGYNRAAEAGLASPQGAWLAYEHDLRIELEADQITPRLAALTKACQEATFGTCVVLQVGEQGAEVPSATLKVRMAPAGVEPFIALAGDKGRVASRNSHAEDLAQQVADTQLTQARLKKEYATLQGYQQRGDLAVADLLTVSKRMAELEADMEAAARDAAQQRHRVETQLVTISLDARGGASGRSEISAALRDFGEVFTTSVAFVIRAVAALLPVGAVLWVLGWVGLKLWRRRRARATNK